MVLDSLEIVANYSKLSKPISEVGKKVKPDSDRVYHQYAIMS